MDREKVIRGLETCIKYIDQDCPIGCPYFEACTKYEGRVVFQPVLRDVFELLKQQPEIVRCLDCHYHDAGENESEAWNRCRLHRIDTDDDEFCSWGVKENDWQREGNQRA